MLWEEEVGPEVRKGCQGGMIMLEEEALPLEKSSGDWDRKAEEVGGGWGKRNRWGRRAVLRAEGKAVIALERKP